MLQGILYIVSTPIGNLKDITLRAIEVLKNCDIIVCEDSRRASLLIKNFVNEKKKYIVYHDHNKEKVAPLIIKKLKEGFNIALITDAGTPIISDPGFYLVRQSIKENIEITSVPGPSSILAALVVSGLPPDRWIFEGYIKKRKGRRKKQIEKLKNEERTIIFFESPFRIVDTLHEIKEILGNRRISLCRELTKFHEEVIRGTIEDVMELLSKREKIKGEIVLIVEGLTKDEKKNKRAP